MDKQELIKILRAEIIRQAESDDGPSPYVWDEEDVVIGIDGHLDIGGLAEAVANSITVLSPHRITETDDKPVRSVAVGQTLAGR